MPNRFELKQLREAAEKYTTIEYEAKKMAEICGIVMLQPRFES